MFLLMIDRFGLDEAIRLCHSLRVELPSPLPESLKVFLTMDRLPVEKRYGFYCKPPAVSNSAKFQT